MFFVHMGHHLCYLLEGRECIHLIKMSTRENRVFMNGHMNKVNLPVFAQLKIGVLRVGAENGISGRPPMAGHSTHLAGGVSL